MYSWGLSQITQRPSMADIKSIIKFHNVLFPVILVFKPNNDILMSS